MGSVSKPVWEFILLNRLETESWPRRLISHRVHEGAEK
jgi:hypothetical protein